MSVYSALSPISVGIYQALNVPSLLAVAPGGVHDAVPQNPTYPFVLYVVGDEDASTFGARPGSGPGSMVRIRLRCSAYSEYHGMKECQTVVAKLRELLRVEPTAVGYHVWTIFPMPTVAVGDEVIAGLPVRELAAEWILDVEEAA